MSTHAGDHYIRSAPAFRLPYCFVMAARSEVEGFTLARAFPAALAADVRAVEALLGQRRLHSDCYLAELATERVAIHSRIYGEVPGTMALSATQWLILHCILTRHDNGYVRQAHVEPLLAQREEWICPFVWLAVGEYVYEIVELIAAHVGELDFELYTAFLARNPALRELVLQRAISFWNPRFRRKKHEHFEKYPTYPIFARFGIEAPFRHQTR